MKFFAWTTIISATLGGLFGFFDFVFAKGAPQQAAAAAFGVLCAVVPYTIARSLQMLRTEATPKPE